MINNDAYAILILNINVVYYIIQQLEITHGFTMHNINY